MLKNEELFTQSLNDHLYYLRSIRQFCLTIELTFFKNNKDYIEKASEFAIRCQELGVIAIDYTGGIISENALENEIYVTKYTLDSELLTEKLFGIDINTVLTEDELKLRLGNDTLVVSIDKIDKLNRDALILATEFQEFCRSIREAMKSNNLFSYSYIDYLDYLIDDVNTYILDLNRLINKEGYSPIYAVGYEYYFSLSLAKTATFIRGWIDPIYQDVLDLANYYVNSFNNIINEYLKTSLSPNSQTSLANKTLSILDDYQFFISDVLERLLKGDIYLITPAITIDNIYTSVNFYKYTLSIQKKLIK